VKHPSRPLPEHPFQTTYEYIAAAQSLAAPAAPLTHRPDHERRRRGLGIGLGLALAAHLALLHDVKVALRELAPQRGLDGRPLRRAGQQAQRAGPGMRALHHACRAPGGFGPCGAVNAGPLWRRAK